MTKDTKTSGAHAPAGISNHANSKSLPGFDLDPADYAAELSSFDLSEEEARAFLEALWSIMRSFVELGFTPDLRSVFLRDFEDVSKAAADDVSFLPSPISKTEQGASEKGRQA